MARDFTKTTLNYPQSADTPIKRVIVERAPTTSDTRNFTLGDEWLDTSVYDWWKLVRIAGSPAIATWIKIGTGNSILSLTGVDNATKVFPDGLQNINFVGAGGITVDGNNATHTLTITGSGGAGTVQFLAGNDMINVGPNGSGVINVIGAPGVNITNTALNTLTVDANGSLFWQVIALDQMAVKNNGYFTNGPGVLHIALPILSNVGDTFEVADIGGLGFQITQAGGQQIRLGSQTTTNGPVGTLTSTKNGDHIRLVCSVANFTWVAMDPLGNFLWT